MTKPLYGREEEEETWCCDDGENGTEEEDDEYESVDCVVDVGCGVNSRLIPIDEWCIWCGVEEEIDECCIVFDKWFVDEGDVVERWLVKRVNASNTESNFDSNCNIRDSVDNDSDWRGGGGGEVGNISWLFICISRKEKQSRKKKTSKWIWYWSMIKNKKKERSNTKKKK